MRVAVDADLPLLHGLEQRGLRLSGRTVDFVGEEEGRENRPAHEVEFVLLQVEDGRSRDVGRHQVWRELDAVELAAENMGERADKQRLGHAWHAFDERMAAREDGDEREVHHALLSDDDLGDLLARSPEDFLELIEVGLHEIQLRLR